MINFVAKKKKMLESEFEYAGGIKCSEYDNAKIFTSDIFDAYTKSYKHILVYKETKDCDLMRIEYSQDDNNKCIVIEDFKYEKSTSRNHISHFLDFCFSQISELAYFNNWNILRSYNFTVIPNTNKSFIHMLWFNNCDLDNKPYVEVAINNENEKLT